jgi:hypothetical protein
MTRRLPGIALLVTLVTVGHAVMARQGPALTPADIDAAIGCGLGTVKCDPPRLYLTLGKFMGIGTVRAEVLPPLGRIYAAARDAKAKYLPFAASNVDDAMRAPVLDVFVRDEDSDMKMLTSIEHVVLLPKGAKSGAIQPSKIEPWDAVAQNLAGAAITRVGKHAQFDLGTIPAGDVDVVAATQYREIRATIAGKDRAKLALWIGR